MADSVKKEKQKIVKDFAQFYHFKGAGTLKTRKVNPKVRKHCCHHTVSAIFIHIISVKNVLHVMLQE